MILINVLKKISRRSIKLVENIFKQLTLHIIQNLDEINFKLYSKIIKAVPYYTIYLFSYETIEEQVLLPNACHQGCEIADFVIIPKSIVVYGTL